MLPREFCRGPQWRSHSERSVWEPALRQAQTAWSELEVASVSSGVRDSALLVLTADEIGQASADCAFNGLQASVVGRCGDGFRVAIHRPGLSATWHRAWMASDDDLIGSMLGFPKCCRDFFLREWRDRGSYDVTHAMSTLDGPWQSNILMRWMGVRLVPHLPCSASCSATLDLAERYLAVAQETGIDVSPLKAILSLPVTHDALNGVAIISTPHFRFMASTEIECSREVLSRKRVCTPEDVHGDTIIRSNDCQDNGFSTPEAMGLAHACILGAVRGLGDGAFPVLDLGCGDGRLLSLFGVDGCVGVESDHGRASRGRALNGSVTILDGDIRAALPEIKERFGTALLMPGRLTEWTSGECESVLAHLRRVAEHVVAYAYGDWISRGGLVGLCGPRTGLEICGPIHRGEGVEAAEVRVRNGA